MAIYIGIDGGGTKTTCLVGDESSVLGSAAAGGSNVVRLGAERAARALETAVREACAAANISPHTVRRTCVGMSGAGRAEISGVVKQAVGRMVGGEIEVIGDHITTLTSAFSDGPGIIVIGGTGSLAYGRNAQGETGRAGGWGWAISDEGSGHWIGRAAVSAAFRARDEAQSTTLLDRIVSAWGLTGPEHLVVTANASPPADFASLVPVVLSAANESEPVAREVLSRAGAELASLAKMVAGHLFAKETSVPVAMSGGVFRHCAVVRQSFYNGLEACSPRAVVATTIADPVYGALELARRVEDAM